jgi:hypothetical protein
MLTDDVTGDPTMVLGSSLFIYFSGVNGGVVHGRGTIGGQWWCSAWSWVRIFDFLGVNGGVVHGRGFESMTFGINGGRVVHGLGFESLTFGGSKVV